MAKLGKAVKGKSKKKKKGAGKGAGDAKDAALLAKLNEMEQADYRRKLAMQTRAALKEALTKERDMAKVNAKKVKNGWLKIMRLAAVDSLRRDVEVISQNHERDVDRRDALLQMLDRDIDEAEEQLQMALREHMRNVDSLITLQDSRLQTLEVNFEEDLEALENEFAVEREQIDTQHAQNRKELQDLIEAVAAQETYKAAEAKQEFEQLREEVRNKNIEEINVLSATLDQQIEELERQFESAHMNYLQSTDKRTEEFKRYTREDNFSARSIEEKVRSIERLQASLQEWKLKIVRNSTEYNEKNRLLAEEKAMMAGHVAKLKQKMNRYRNTQGGRLTNLSKDVAAAKAKLRETERIAENLLSMAERARKMETDKEKIQPYIGSSVKDSDVEELEKAGRDGEQAMEMNTREKNEKWLAQLFQGTTVEPGAQSALAPMLDKESITALDNFMQRYNNAVLTKLALENEKAKLARENSQLQSVLKQFLEGISVTPSVMTGANPLLVLNGQTNTLPQPVRPKAETAHIPVVDSAHMIGSRQIRLG